MNILVCGSGPLGSLFAARLQQGGHTVTLLARGQRLSDLRQHGIVLHDARTDAWTTTRVAVIDRLEPERAFDLALVIMRKNQALDLLPVLAANRRIPSILFLMNNAAGPDELVKAVDRIRMAGARDADDRAHAGHRTAARRLRSGVAADAGGQCRNPPRLARGAGRASCGGRRVGWRAHRDA